MAYSAYVSEIFVSLEGEGPCTGVPTLFVRLFGCNLKCPGFNNHGDTPQTVKMFAKEALENEGTVSGGCDSLYSWHPSFKDKRTLISAEELAERIEEGYTAGKFKRVSFTGGEPMLHQKFIAAVLDTVDSMYDEDLEDGSDGEGPLTVPKWDGLISGNRVLVNIETNGTQPLDEDLADWVVSADSMQTEDYENDDGDGFWTPNLPVTLTISPKLSNSGESEDARFPTLLEDRSFFRRHVPIIKAVVNSQEDVNELKVLLKKVHLKYSPRFTYLMAEAATRKQLRTNEPKVAELALKNGLSYTSRLHVTLYDNAPGT